MNKDEVIEYAIRTSEVIKEEKKTELINYFYNKKEVIDKAIEYIEKEYYSKNTVDIESMGITTNKLLQVRNLLNEVSE